jgi:hypothetical protein
MADEADDYTEFGRSIAGAILEGGKSKKWALGMVSPLGCGRIELEQWLKRYRNERYQAIRWQRQKREHRRAKIEALEAQAEQILKNLNET